MRVWREGDRIRNEKGVGYADSVTDGAILDHLRVGEPYAHEYREFAYSVLAHRERERGEVEALSPPPSSEGAAGGETP